MPLRYRPTWLPPGFTERSRSGVAGTAPPDSIWSVSQIWTKGSGAVLYTGGPRLELAVERVKDGVDPLGAGGVEVTVNGRPGRLVGTPGTAEKSYLSWMPDAATVLLLSQVDYRLSKAELLRIARSVRPTRAVQGAPLRVGWLPAGMVVIPNLTIVGNSERFWQASLYAQPPAPKTDAKAAGQDSASVVLSVGTVTEAPAGGEQITVDGRPARFVVRAAEPKPPLIRSYVVVELGDGMLLTVAGMGSAISRADLVRIAATARVEDAADLSWLGAR
jgi:hypothetical protein